MFNGMVTTVKEQLEINGIPLGPELSKEQAKANYSSYFPDDAVFSNVNDYNRPTTREDLISQISENARCESLVLSRG